MSRFRADCSQCCGLCCVVPSFLVVQGFREDKAAETPCVHLRGGRCSIHKTRGIHGYSACEGFDCFGAGQWITQELFKGATWADSPDIARAMFDAYRAWLPRFEAAALLEAALPFARADAQGLLQGAMEKLTSVAAMDQGTSTDALRHRRQTLALIRSALQSDTEVRIDR